MGARRWHHQSDNPILEIKQDTCVAQWVKKQPATQQTQEIPWRRAWQPTPVFLPVKSMERGTWRVTVHGVSEPDTLSICSVGHIWAHKLVSVCVCVYMRATWKLLFNTTLLQPTNFNFPLNLSLQLRNIFLDCLEFPLTYHIGWVCRTQNVLHVCFPWKLSHQHVMVFQT